MRVKRGDRETVTLLPGNLTMEQPLDMTLFSITDYRLDNLTTGIHMIIKMKRKITSEMMTTYFPSLLLREGVNGKKTFSFGHCPNYVGGVYPCLNFLALFLEMHFWSIKRVYFFKNANVLNF